ncbi:MAG TPA: hypothetical protein VES89_06845, partial [Candidatus Competibacteraceae bacterium]|nr:hypothetical protein [Candidatus Competibacteraceae bacterium]
MAVWIVWFRLDAGETVGRSRLMARRHLSERQREQIRRTQEQRRRRAAERAARQADELDHSGLGAEQPGLVIANYGPALIV